MQNPSPGKFDNCMRARFRQLGGRPETGGDSDLPDYLFDAISGGHDIRAGDQMERFRSRSKARPGRAALRRKLRARPAQLGRYGIGSVESLDHDELDVCKGRESVF